MSNEIRQTELLEKTQQLLQGPLKHIRAAALAAALLPLASVVATPASAQTVCPSAGICGTVFTDTNNNGILDNGDTPIADVAVTTCLVPCDGMINTPQTVYTNPYGFYFCSDCAVGGTYTVAVLIPTGTQASPVVVGGNAGVTNGAGYSVATAVASESGSVIDFGFAPSQQQPGTATPGYWKNHPEAWPASIAASGITVGGVTYSETDAIGWLTKVGKDKTTTMFAALVPAMLNLLIGNDGSCVNAAIASGNAWMATYGPVGRNVAASSYAWSIGQPTQQTLDAYNNGLLCAPHRQ
jgi:hypothetical protein